MYNIPHSMMTDFSRLNKNTSDLETQIDQMVYALYGLNEEEVDLVEGNRK